MIAIGMKFLRLQLGFIGISFIDSQVFPENIYLGPKLCQKPLSLFVLERSMLLS